jgi:hypothetical protein
MVLMTVISFQGFEIIYGKGGSPGFFEREKVCFSGDWDFFVALGI